MGPDGVGKERQKSEFEGIKRKNWKYRSRKKSWGEDEKKGGREKEQKGRETKNGLRFIAGKRGRGRSCSMVRASAKKEETDSKGLEKPFVVKEKRKTAARRTWGTRKKKS